MDPSTGTPFTVARYSQYLVRRPPPDTRAAIGSVQDRRDSEQATTSPRRATDQHSNFYAVHIGETLGSAEGHRFEVLDFLGKGSFGQVVKVRKLDIVNLNEPEYYAIKIIRKSTPFLSQGKREVGFLNWIKRYGGTNAKNFIVQFVEAFMHEKHLCLVFELLSTSLLDLVNLSIEACPVQPGLSLRMVHKFSHQLITVLYTLAKIKLIHCDIKPENISLTSPNVAHIKVLDFGSSCHASENVCNMFPYIQSRFYRSPEVLLGCKYSYPIDMWSLGCVLVELYIAKPLFAGKDKVEQLYVILDTLGWPPRELLGQAVHYKYFFRDVAAKTVPRQEFKWTPWKKSQIPLWEKLNIKTEYPNDLEMFFDLISQMLIYDPDKRITPEEALSHPFILKGPAARNRDTQDEPRTPSQQRTPPFTPPVWSYPAFGGIPLSKSLDRKRGGLRVATNLPAAPKSLPMPAAPLEASSSDSQPKTQHELVRQNSKSNQKSQPRCPRISLPNRSQSPRGSPLSSPKRPQSPKSDSNKQSPLHSPKYPSPKTDSSSTSGPLPSITVTLVSEK